MIKRIATTLISTSLIACGSGKDDGSNESKQAQTASSKQNAYATAVDLPECSAATEGNLAYVKDQAILSFCEDGQWVPARLGGDSEMALTARTYCKSQFVSQTSLSNLGLNAAPVDGMYLSYEIMEFEGGIAMIAATITLNSQSLSASIIRHSSQGSFSTFTSSSITYDVHGSAGLGDWTFKKDATLTGNESQPYAAVYRDSELSSPVVRPFLTAECSSE
jgi:hypothetical protein